jgi:hypothetical protein
MSVGSSAGSRTATTSRKTVPPLSAMRARASGISPRPASNCRKTRQNSYPAHRTATIPAWSRFRRDFWVFRVATSTTRRLTPSHKCQPSASGACKKFPQRNVRGHPVQPHFRGRVVAQILVGDHFSLVFRKRMGDARGKSRTRMSPAGKGGRLGVVAPLLRMGVSTGFMGLPLSSMQTWLFKLWPAVRPDGRGRLALRSDKKRGSNRPGTATARTALILAFRRARFEWDFFHSA